MQIQCIFLLSSFNWSSLNTRKNDKCRQDVSWWISSMTYFDVVTSTRGQRSCLPGSWFTREIKKVFSQLSLCYIIFYFFLISFNTFFFFVFLNLFIIRIIIIFVLYTGVSTWTFSVNFNFHTFSRTWNSNFNHKSLFKAFLYFIYDLLLENLLQVNYISRLIEYFYCPCPKDFRSNRAI